MSSLPQAPVGSRTTFLFAPAHDERKVTRALSSGAGAVILDLEDAVPAELKEVARGAALEVLAARQPGGPVIVVRANSATSAPGAADLAALTEAGPDAVMLPKCDPAVLALAPAGLPLIPLLESAAGIAGAREVAADPRVERLMLGSLDLAADLGLVLSAAGTELAAVRWELVLASGLAGLLGPIDGVYPRHRDLDGLRAEAELARWAGMAAKACIHPAQLATVDEVFAPATTQLEWAEAVLAAWEAAGGDAGAIAVNGEMVDAPQVRRARALRDAATESEPAKENYR